jgi:hypothetical protein
VKRTPITFKLMVDLDEILYGDEDTEDDLDSTLFDPVASTISKCGRLNF